MRRSGRTSGRTLVQVALMVVLVCMLGAKQVSATAPWTVEITSVSTTDGVTTIAGTADSPANEQSGNYLQIDWGDGTVETFGNFAGSGPWAWGPHSHTYAPGAYTITVVLLHAVEKGNDRSLATDTADVTIPDVPPGDVPPGDTPPGDGPDDADDSPGDTSPGDGPDDADDSPGDDTDVGNNTQGSDDEDETSVLGNRIARLPKTGPATTSILLAGIGFLLSGGTMNVASRRRPRARR